MILDQLVDKRSKKEYYNLYNLIIFLALHVVNLILNYIWTIDKGWIPFVSVICLSVSTLFWLILCFIAEKRAIKFKNELSYFIGLGLWGILSTLVYFKILVLGSVLVDFLSFVGLWPYITIIVLWLLPIKIIRNLVEKQ